MADSISEHKVLEISLHGSWREMGQQYGDQARIELHKVLQFLERKYDGSVLRTERIANVSRMLVSHYPDRYLDMIRGMSETSGLSYEQLLLVNAVEYAEGEFGCSALAVWGNYTPDGRLIYGRNYDGASFAPLSDCVVLVRFAPNDGSLAFSMVGYAGEIYALSGWNEAGVFVELNNGMPSTGFDVDWNEVPSTTTLMDALRCCRSIDEVELYLQQHRSASGFIIGITDGKEARACEWCKEGCRAAVRDASRLVITNHYTSNLWHYEVPTDGQSWRSLTRRKNLLDISDCAKGTITTSVMKDVLTHNINVGGPMMTELSLYHIVYDVAASAIWIKVEPYSNWQRFDY